MDGVLETTIAYTADQDITNAFDFEVKEASGRYSSGMVPYVRIYKGKGLDCQ